MSLSIYYSDRIEDLANHLKGRLVEERRASDPFAFSTVVVPNTNIAKWLQIRKFSDTRELCVGIEFPFIEGFLFDLLARCLPDKDQADGARPKPLQMNAYSTGILSILLKDDDTALAPFRRYIAGGKDDPLTIDSREKARMAWQLSVKLADLIDKYEVYRPEIVKNWFGGWDAKGRELEHGSIEAAEAALAKKLFGEDGLYPPDGAKISLRQLFDRVLKKKVRPSKDKLPIYFFGLSTLSPLQVEILYWLAPARDIVFYHDNVCLEYWGDIETKKELLRRLPTADDDLAMTHPLLQQWGAAGRETLRLLVGLEEKNGGSAHPFRFEWKRLDSAGFGERENMLAKVQRSIRTFAGEDVAGEGGVRLGEDRVAKQDASIQIVAAPGIRREVETVHNAILGAVWGPQGDAGKRPWGDGGRCKFSDIAVLVPDMATYRPVIEAVFDGRGEIPYALIDTTASEDSAYLQGFLDLMALARDGLSRETLFAVLDNPCVQRALSFGPDDAAEWRRYANAIGAFDGFDAKGDFGNLSWGRALRRLRLGRVAVDRDDLSVWDGGDSESALKLSEIVETLYRELRDLAWKRNEEPKRLSCARPPAERNAAAGAPTWADELRRIANEFLAVARDDKLEGPVKGQVFGTLSSLHVVEIPQSLDFVVAAVEEFVGGVKCQTGSYLAKGVTVAGLMPMRPVPFRQVFVLGMGEGMFPGRDSATTLEIPGAARSLGDVQPTAVRKHLFLETLMAVQDRLVLSYPCLDPVKDAELFPSGMVCELEKFLSDYILPPTVDNDGKEKNAEFREVKAPLLERAEEADFLPHRDGHSKKDLPENPVGPVTWTDDWYAGILTTYSDVERRIALGENAKRDGREAPAGSRVEIRTDDLADFLERPLRSVLQHLYGIGVEGYRDGSIDPEAPLEIPYGPVQWEFNRKLLDVACGGAPDIAGAYAPFAAKGTLPEARGFFGTYSIDKTSAKFSNKDLHSLKIFADGFLPADWEKPDPVRTVLPASEGIGEKHLPERLFTAKTKDWKFSGAESRILLFNQCGDTRGRGKGEINQTPFPPQAVIKPFVAWVAKVAGETGADARTLRVGIVDIDKCLHNEWKWTITPEEAKAWLDGVAGAYLRYLDESEDGLYLDFGYPDLVKAFEKAKKDGKIADKIPDASKDEEWQATVDSFSRKYDSGEKKGFDNGLVVDETVGPMGRFPGEGDDTDAAKDVADVKARYGIWFKRILDGVRVKEGV